MIAMFKKNALTVLGIALSFAVAALGWAVTSRLIDLESDRLIYGTTSFPVDTPTIEPVNLGEDDDPGIVFGLPYGEVVSILQNWELTNYRRIHEPAPGQIDLEAAILAGRMGLVFLQEQNILHSETMTFDSTRAFLSQNVPNNEGFLPLRYSYWTVAFVNNEITASMIINAVTGQVWEIYVHTGPPWLWIEPETARVMITPSPEDVIDVVPAFASGLGMSDDGAMNGMLYLLEIDEDRNLRFYDIDDDGVLIHSATRYLFPSRLGDWGFGFNDDVLVYKNIANGNARVEFIGTGWLMHEEALHLDMFTIRLAKGSE